jgi:hypothetical protein
MATISSRDYFCFFSASFLVSQDVACSNSSKCENDSGDLLLMEPILLPGTLILVDGRTNNARFLQRNFERNWNMVYDAKGDITTFELIEGRLGPYNILGSDFFK